MAKKNGNGARAERSRSQKVKSMESWIWDAACSIRGAQDAPKYKDFILPLIFVKRNIERFPESFRFQLDETEKLELVTNCDRFEKLKHSSINPYAFTEQGVAMLSAFSKMNKDLHEIFNKPYIGSQIWKIK